MSSDFALGVTMWFRYRLLAQNSNKTLSPNSDPQDVMSTVLLLRNIMNKEKIWGVNIDSKRKFDHDLQQIILDVVSFPSSFRSIHLPEISRRRWLMSTIVLTPHELETHSFNDESVTSFCEVCLTAFLSN